MLPIPNEFKQVPGYIKQVDKVVKQSPLQNDIVLTSEGVYFNVAHNPDNAYLIQNQLKIILRCVWRLLYDKFEQPNYKFLKTIFNNRVDRNIPKITLRIPKGSNILKQESLFPIEYCLIPAIEYDTKTLDWDKYLFIFQNIVMAKNANYRLELKKMKLERLQNADSEDEINEINANYVKEVNEMKDEQTFSVVDFLNYIYHNNVKLHHMAWRTVLLRYQVNSIFDETIVYEPSYFVQEMLKHRDDPFLIRLLINIYRRNYLKTISLEEYLTNYVNIMVNQMLKPYTDFELDFSTKDYEITKLFMSDDEIIEKYLDLYIKVNTFKTKMVYNFMCDTFSDDLLAKHNVHAIFGSSRQISDITTIFNKITDKTYDKLVETLNKYDEETLLNAFYQRSFKDVNLYTPYVLCYLSKRVGDGFVDDILSKPRPSFDPKFNACYYCVLRDNRFLDGLDTQDLIKALMECKNFINFGVKTTKRHISSLIRKNRKFATKTYELVVLDDVVELCKK